MNEMAFKMAVERLNRGRQPWAYFPVETHKQLRVGVNKIAAQSK
jgi:hypothetical protein